MYTSNLNPYIASTTSVINTHICESCQLPYTEPYDGSRVPTCPTCRNAKQQAKENAYADFLDGFRRVCEEDGISLQQALFEDLALEIGKSHARDFGARMGNAKFPVNNFAWSNGDYAEEPNYDSNDDDGPYLGREQGLMYLLDIFVPNAYKVLQIQARLVAFALGSVVMYENYLEDTANEIRAAQLIDNMMATPGCYIAIIHDDESGTPYLRRSLITESASGEEVYPENWFDIPYQIQGLFANRSRIYPLNGIWPSKESAIAAAKGWANSYHHEVAVYELPQAYDDLKQQSYDSATWVPWVDSQKMVWYQKPR